jgi:hypothetical protein
MNSRIFVLINLKDYDNLSNNNRVEIYKLIMIRTCLSLFLLSIVLTTISVVDYKKFDYGHLELDKVDRMINLNGAYPEETIKAVVRNLGNDPTKTFYHVVSNNISRNIADIKFVGSNDLKYSVSEVMIC